MIDTPIFTLVHIVISLVGIVAGLVVMGGLMAGARMDGWTAVFLATTVLTNLTGFLFPFTKVLPSHIVGALSLVLLAVCVVARYWKHMEGRWRTAYVATAVAAVYFNVFVLVSQLFVKTPALVQLAPTQREAPFAVTHALILALFVWLGLAAVRRFRMRSTTLDSFPGAFAQAH